ncbi:unnamed protein product [Cylicocyclus nassatus]|uniref:NADH dehydrogenase [ubiquinone] 1 alpha subcomplex subunit 7 n=1 Tax=Cylicocyclus nassatus TaxID=53992 RepID=A0AA36GTH2_CYLNA|nr:unnamed protein product [Cylicocyclus nassatus]
MSDSFRVAISGRKIADAATKNRTQTTFWTWLRNKLLAVDRLPGTPAPGILGKAERLYITIRYVFLRRSQRTQILQNYPHYLVVFILNYLAENYYYTRDGRRVVLPPNVLYVADAHGVEFGSAKGEKIERDKAIQVKGAQTITLACKHPRPVSALSGNAQERRSWKRKETSLNLKNWSALTDSRQASRNWLYLDQKMRTSAVSLAKHFGWLGKMYGEHRFALAPNEQKAFKGFIDRYRESKSTLIPQ